MIIPLDIKKALKSGCLTEKQLKKLIIIEACYLGLSFDEAIIHQKDGILPHTTIGFDLDMLIFMWRNRGN